MGWLGNVWLYRQSVVIDNTANTISALLHYQVSIFQGRILTT
jgi:hypothetical protein